MITQVNNGSLANIIANDATKNRQTKESAGTSQNGITSKAEQLKELINSGKYKVDLSALANKMADELL